MKISTQSVASERRRCLRRMASLPAVLASPLAAWLPASASAQPAWPPAGANIRYVVPFPPGGLTDVMARQVGDQLGRKLGANVIVENRPGNGGQIGADIVAKAPGDGQTILAITMTHAANATLYRNRAPFDFRKDLRPVALLAGSPMLIVVPADSPIRSVADLRGAAKSRALNAGSSGNGTPPHLTLALFNQLVGTKIEHVPYKGGAQSMTDLIGGRLDVIFSNFPESYPHVTGGKLRALAIASEKRHPLVPDVPTTAEAGLPELAVENWTAVMAPATTPDGIVDRLGTEIVGIMGASDMEERARTQGFRVDARGPKAFAAFLQHEVQRWEKTIQAAGIRID